MAQRKQITWSELRVGLFVLVGLLILAVAIFYVTGAGFLGPKYRLKTFLPEVSGLAVGAPVRLDGVEIGNVEKIRLVPRQTGKPPDRMHNIEVDIRIDARYQGDVLTDSTASLVTEGLLGNRYVNVQRGYTGVPLKEGQAIPGTEEKAIKEVVERSADVLANLKALSEEIQDIVGDVHEGKGSIGKLLHDDQAYNHLNSILAKGDQIVGNVQSGQGTLGKILMNDELYAKVDKGVDNVNTILADVRAQKGTIGKLLTDETLYNKLRDTSTNLSEATSKLNKNDNSVGKIFNDPQLYDNMAAASAELRTFLTEFRKNPRKYLTVKMSFF